MPLSLCPDLSRYCTDTLTLPHTLRSTLCCMYNVHESCAFRRWERWLVELPDRRGCGALHTTGSVVQMMMAWHGVCYLISFPLHLGRVLFYSFAMMYKPQTQTSSTLTAPRCVGRGARVLRFLGSLYGSGFPSVIGIRCASNSPFAFLSSRHFSIRGAPQVPSLTSDDKGLGRVDPCFGLCGEWKGGGRAEEAGNFNASNCVSSLRQRMSPRPLTCYLYAYPSVAGILQTAV